MKPLKRHLENILVHVTLKAEFKFSLLQEDNVIQIYVVHTFEV